MHFINFWKSRSYLGDTMPVKMMCSSCGKEFYCNADKKCPNAVKSGNRVCYCRKCWEPRYGSIPSELAKQFLDACYKVKKPFIFRWCPVRYKLLSEREKEIVQKRFRKNIGKWIPHETSPINIWRFHYIVYLENLYRLGRKIEPFTFR